MPSEIRPGTGYGTAAFPENAVLRKLRGLLPGRGEPPAPGQGTGQKPSDAQIDVKLTEIYLQKSLGTLK